MIKCIWADIAVQIYTSFSYIYYWYFYYLYLNSLNSNLQNHFNLYVLLQLYLNTGKLEQTTTFFHLHLCLNPLWLYAVLLPAPSLIRPSENVRLCSLQLSQRQSDSVCDFLFLYIFTLKSGQEQCWIENLHIHTQTLTSMLISNLLPAACRLTSGKVCKFPSAFLPGEECQRKYGAILNHFKNAWNVCSWTLTVEEIVATGMILFFLLYTCVQEKKISYKRM